MIYIDKEYINNGNQDATLKDYLNYKNIKCKY